MKNKVICIGEILYDCFFIKSDFSESSFFKLSCYPGGAPANVAVGLARLNLKSSFVGVIGNDVLGEKIKKYFENEGVDISNTIISKNKNTSLTLVNNYSNKKYLSYKGADCELKLTNKILISIAKTKNMAINSVTLTRNKPIVLLNAINIAYENKNKIYFDLNIRMNYVNKNLKNNIIKCIKKSTIIKLNVQELNLLFGSNKITYAKQILKYGPKLILLTCGDKGAYYLTDKFFEHVDTIDVQEVDDTGAGDSFLSAFISKTYHYEYNEISSISNETLYNSVFFSNIAGALTSTKISTIHSLPKEHEIEEVYKQHYS